MTDVRDPMLLLTSAGDLPRDARVWGTGGWHPPQEREALDWLTLARLAGWAVTVTRADTPIEADLEAGNRWIVIACDSDELSESVVQKLAARLDAEPLLIVARAGRRDGAFARISGAWKAPHRATGGGSIDWLGPGGKRTWQCRWLLELGLLDRSSDATAWATLDGVPIIAARRAGRGTIATLAFHPSEARDRDGAMTALLRHLLILGAGAPVAWHDLDGTLVLRMDDAGGAQNVHLQSWTYTKLDQPRWEMVGADLARRKGRMSIGYVSGWVDDGDPARGLLEVAGQRVERVQGQVHPSPLVTYRPCSGLTPVNDYQAEYRGIQALRQLGLADVELHGYTHMYPDPTVWAKAPDRLVTTAWYRELGREAEAIIARLPADQRPLPLALHSVRQYFDVRPTTLICPGDEFTNAPVERALDLGLRFVSSYYLALRDRERFCWAQHVCAPYLDQDDAAWFDSGLPVVGYFHDHDLATHGVSWLGACLDRWLEAGARRLLDFRELAGIAGRTLSLEDDAGRAQLECAVDGAPDLVRPLIVGLRWPGERLPARVHARLDGRELPIAVEPLTAGVGRAILPVTSPS